VTKALTADMRTHLDGTVTTLASCWRIVRTDGAVFAFTGHDRDLTIDGLTYLASSSFDRSAVESDPTMAVDNLEIQGVFDNEALRADELRAGLFDKAAVELFLVNWADLEMGRVQLRRGWLGEVTLTPSGIFKSEIRGLIQALQQNVGEVYTTQCRADLGDSRCRVPVNPPVVARGQDVVALQYYRKKDLRLPDDGSSALFHDVIFQVLEAGTTADDDVLYDYVEGNETVDGSATLLAVTSWSRYGVVASDGVGGQTFHAYWPYGIDPRVAGGVGDAPNPGVQFTSRGAVGVTPSPNTWFNDGILTWESGLNVGVSMEVQLAIPSDAVVGGTEFVLHLPVGFPIDTGDKFRVYAGCSKLIGVKPAALQPTSVYGTFEGTTLTVTDPDGCFPKFNNAVNFRGEPFIPGVDFIVGQAGLNKPGFQTPGGKK
jgi:hypothetical protein